MFIGKQKKFRVLASLVTILSLASATSCTGFFQNPVLTTVTIGPQTPTINVGGTLQMSATGTYNDGSTKNLSSGVFWSSSDSTVASISSAGLVTGVSNSSATITGSSGTVSGTTTVTVQLTGIVSIQVSPSSQSITSGQIQQYTATATLTGGGTQDVTNSAVWASSNSSAGTIATSGGLFTPASGLTQSQQTTITATEDNVISNGAILTVNP